MEAACASCDHACAPMIVSGWGVCKKCRKKDRLDFTAVNESIPTAAGRDWIKRAIRAHLAKGEAA